MLGWQLPGVMGQITQNRVSEKKRIMADIQSVILRLTHNDPLLTELRLAYNYVGDQGATAVGKSLTANSVLEKLSLASSHVGARGAEELCKGVAHNRGIKGLSWPLPPRYHRTVPFPCTLPTGSWWRC